MDKAADFFRCDFQVDNPRYGKLLILGVTKNGYRVLVGLMDLVIDKFGVDPYNVFAIRNFVKDL